MQDRVIVTMEGE